jgi:hypothetical protein
MKATTSSSYLAQTLIPCPRFDASAHLSEETKKASWSAPIGVISSVGFSALFGFFVILSFLFSIQDFDRTISSNYGNPVLQIFVDVFGEDGAIVLFSLIIICVWHCGLFSLTSNSRMMFAFARDGGIVRPFAFPLLFTKKANLDDFSPVSSPSLTNASAAQSAPVGHHLPFAPILKCSQLHSLARRVSFILPRPPLPRLLGRLRRRNINRHHRPVHLLRPSDPDCLNIPQRIHGQERALQPRYPLPSYRIRRLRLDRLHHNHFLSTGGQSGQQGDAELHGCRRGHYLLRGPRHVVCDRKEVVCGTVEGD